MAMCLKKNDDPVCKVYFGGDVPKTVRELLGNEAPPMAD